MIFSSFVSFASPAAAGTEWQEVSRTPDVTVYRKEIAGSPVLAYKAEGQVDAPIARVVAVVRDTARLSEWTYRVKEGEILETLSSNERIEYIHASAPWPAQDRDAVYRSKLSFGPEPGHVSYCFHSVEDPRRPEREDRVRAQIDESCFRFAPIGQGRATRIEAEVQGDPKGSVPKWLVSLVQKRAPAQSIRNLAKRLNSSH